MKSNPYKQEIKVLLQNGDSFCALFNGTEEDAKAYYVGKIFNIGTVSDNLQKCIAIEFLKGD